MNDIKTVEYMIERNQLAAQRDEEIERMAWLRREIRTYLNIVTIERIADGVNAGIQRAVGCACVEQCGRKRCGECGR